MKRVLVILTKVTLSIILAGIFYTGWMAITIPTLKAGYDGLIIRALLWILAPIITGFGFALGSKIFILLSGAPNKSSFWNTYKWCLAGCAMGGGILCIFGPMLIVFGMFVAGTLSIVVHEVVTIQKRRQLVKDAG